MAKRYNDFTRGDVRGVAQAVKALEEIGVNVVKAAKAALKQGVNTITEDAKNRVPVYNGLPRADVEAGALKASIKAVGKKEGSVYHIEANAKSSTSGLPYGLFVEFSSKINKPFLYPALDAHQQAVRNSIIQAVQNATKRRGSK